MCESLLGQSFDDVCLADGLARTVQGYLMASLLQDAIASSIPKDDLWGLKLTGGTIRVR